MSLPKISEIQNLSDSELTKEILKSKKLLFELRLKKATRQPFQPHLFKHTKHKINQMLMLQQQRALSSK